jgi:FlgD Ig-like domain/Beta-propeller repeat
MRRISPRFTQIIVVAVLVMISSHPLLATTPLHFWSQRFGSTSADGGQRVVVDASGNIIVVGYFGGTVDFGGGGLVSAGATDIFVAKYTANGTYKWSKRFGSTGADEAHGVTVDAAGNVFVTGYFSGTVDFGGGGLSSAGGWDIFVAKFNANGVHQWSKRFGSTGNDLAKTVSADAAGDVCFTGYATGPVDFGGGVLPAGGSFDIILVKLSPSGAHLWSKRFGTNAIDEGEGAAFDPTGNVVLIGYFQTQIDFGGGVLTGIGGNDIGLAKFDANGAHLWSQRFGSVQDDIGVGIATDTAGNVLVTGLFNLTVDFGGGGLVSAGARDIFVAKFDANGAHQWSQRMGGTNDDISFSAAVDDSGNVFISGATGINVTLAKYTVNGAQEWSQQFTIGLGYGIAVDASGNPVATGEFSSTIDFGGGVLTSAGGNDVFLVKYGAGVDEKPDITSIVDVGNDQGREVKIAFLPSGYDSPGTPLPIVQYEAFRRDDALPSAALTTASAPRISDAASLPTQWVYVGAVPAHGETDYKMLAPTAADSTISQGSYYTTFFIRAATADPFTFFDSAPDSGYSLDNLAPATPSNLAYTPGALSWHESKDADFDYFSIYGSASGAFDESAVLIDYTIGTSLDVSTSPFTYYFVTATDFSGNEGPPARINTLSGVDDTPPIHSFTVAAYPNPFNPGTTLRYRVPSRGRVSVSVFDVHGAMVIRLIDTERSAGSYSVRWEGTDARGVPVSSGAYFVKIQFGNETRTMKIVLLK